MNDTAYWGRYFVRLPAFAKGSRYVYYGYDPRADRAVAIKVSGYNKRACREANLMKGYGYHHALPEFYDFFVQDEQAFLVMEFVPGTRLNYPRPTPPRSKMLAVQITVKVLEGLEHLHSRGILHYDIAHHNILIQDNNPDTLKIVDFCGSKRLNQEGEYLNLRRAGTKNFRSPEQEKAPSLLRPSSDLYAAARLCYWLIVKKLPKPYTPLELEDDQELRSILAKGMHSEPRKRYQEASQFRHALNQWQSEL